MQGQLYKFLRSSFIRLPTNCRDLSCRRHCRPAQSLVIQESETTMIRMIRNAEFTAFLLSSIVFVAALTLGDTFYSLRMIGIYSAYMLVGSVCALFVIRICSTSENSDTIVRKIFFIVSCMSIPIFGFGFLLVSIYGNDPTSRHPYAGGIMQALSSPFAFAGFAWIVAVCWFYLKNKRVLQHKHRT